MTAARFQRAGALLPAVFLALCLVSCSSPEGAGKSEGGTAAYSLDLAKRLLEVKPSDRSVVAVSVTRVTVLSRERLWAAWERLEDWPLWSGSLVISTRWTGEPGWRSGHRFEQVLNLGFPLGMKTFTETVGAAVPGESVVWWGKEGGIETCRVWIFEKLPGGGSRVTRTEVFRGIKTGWLKPYVAWRWKRMFNAALDGLVSRAQVSGRP